MIPRAHTIVERLIRKQQTDRKVSIESDNSCAEMDNRECADRATGERESPIKGEFTYPVVLGYAAGSHRVVMGG